MYYDDYFEPDIDYQQANEDSLYEAGYIHDSELKKIVERMVISFYDTGDTQIMEDCIEDLASFVDIKVPVGMPIMKKKDQPVYFDFMADLTHKHAKLSV